MRRLSGPLLVVTGGLDLMYVLVFHSRQLAAIAGDGFFDAVELDPAQFDRETAFWHLTFERASSSLARRPSCIRARRDG